MTEFKKVMADSVRQVTAIMPECREKAIFVTKMEEGVFFGAKAIAQKPGNHFEITKF